MTDLLAFFFFFFRFNLNIFNLHPGMQIERGSLRRHALCAVQSMKTKFSWGLGECPPPQPWIHPWQVLCSVLFFSGHGKLTTKSFNLAFQPLYVSNQISVIRQTLLQSFHIQRSWKKERKEGENFLKTDQKQIFLHWLIYARNRASCSRSPEECPWNERKSPCYPCP